MAFSVKHGSDTGGLSPALWGDCPIQDYAIGRDGYFVFDDFVQFPTAGTITTVAATGNYMAFASTGGNVVDNAESGGVLALYSDDDNEGASLRSAQLPFKISGITGSKTKKLWFEAKIKTSTIADTKHGIFVGLIDNATLSATVPIAANGTLADQNFVGFHRLEGDGDVMDVVYKANGVTQVTSKEDAVTLVADTWKRVGFKFDPDANTITFYDDGTPIVLTTAVGASVLGATAGTDFPNDVQLGLVMAVLNATGTTPGEADIDWWACAQAR